MKINNGVKIVVNKTEKDTILDFFNVIKNINNKNNAIHGEINHKNALKLAAPFPPLNLKKIG